MVLTFLVINYCSRDYNYDLVFGHKIKAFQYLCNCTILEDMRASLLAYPLACFNYGPHPHYKQHKWTILQQNLPILAFTIHYNWVLKLQNFTMQVKLPNCCAQKFLCICAYILSILTYIMTTVAAKLLIPNNTINSFRYAYKGIHSYWKTSSLPKAQHTY